MEFEVYMSQLFFHESGEEYVVIRSTLHSITLRKSSGTLWYMVWDDFIEYLSSGVLTPLIDDVGLDGYDIADEMIHEQEMGDVSLPLHKTAVFRID